MNRRTFMIELRAEIAKAILEHPELTYAKIGGMFGVCQWVVCDIAIRNKINRKRGRGSSAYKKAS